MNIDKLEAKIDNKFISHEQIKESRHFYERAAYASTHVQPNAKIDPNKSEVQPRAERSDVKKANLFQEKRKGEKGT